MYSSQVPPSARQTKKATADPPENKKQTEAKLKHICKNDNNNNNNSGPTTRLTKEALRDHQEKYSSFSKAAKKPILSL